MSAIDSSSDNHPVYDSVSPSTSSSSKTEKNEILAEMMGEVFTQREDDVSILKKNVLEMGHQLTDISKEMGLTSGIYLPVSFNEHKGELHARRVESPGEEPHGVLDIATGLIHATPGFKEKIEKAHKDGTLLLDDGISKDLEARGVRGIRVAEKTIDPAKLRKYAVAFLTYQAALRALQIANKAHEREDKKKKEQEEVDKRFEQQAILNGQQLAEERAQGAKKQDGVLVRHFSHIVPNVGRGRSTFAAISTPDRKQHAEKMNKRMEKAIQKGIDIREKAIDKQLLQRELADKETTRRLIDEHQVDRVKIEGPPVIVQKFSQQMLAQSFKS